MRRRDLIQLLGGPLALWLVAALARPARPVIGFLGPSSPSAFATFVKGFHEGLKDAGFIEAQTIDIEYRWANGQFDRLPALAAELVALPVQVLVTAGATAAALAAQGATSTVPVVFSVGSDPVKFGLVASINRPGGNITGVSFLSNSLVQKQVELLQELVPAATTIGLLVNPANPNAASDVMAARAAAAALGRQTNITEVHGEGEFDASFESFHAAHCGALLVLADPMFVESRKRLADLGTRWKLPAMYDNRVYPQDGALVSYGANITDAYRQVGVYVGRILKGDKPADLPVFQSTRFELVINLNAAKKIELEIPSSVLSRADEVVD